MCSVGSDVFEIGNDGGGDPDFDFLAPQSNYRRTLCSPTVIFRICISVALFIVFLLLVVNLSKENGGKRELSLESASCFFPLGGGKTGSVLKQTQLLRPACISLFTEYFKQDGQYWKDTEEAIDDARHLLRKRGKYSQMVVLDIDETALSNIPVYQRSAFLPAAAVRRAFTRSGESDAIPATLEFYKNLRNKGFSVSFITGRADDVHNSTIANLETAGYGTKCRRNPAPDGVLCYHKLVTRTNDDHRDATVYKSEARANITGEGFEIIGSVGDQWSDLLGTTRPRTLIKMPNPLYYLP